MSVNVVAVVEMSRAGFEAAQDSFSRFISPDSFLQGKARVHMYTLTRVTLPSRSMFDSRSLFCTYLLG